jgi:hypothetical protein
MALMLTILWILVSIAASHDFVTIIFHLTDSGKEHTFFAVSSTLVAGVFCIFSGLSATLRGVMAILGYRSLKGVIDTIDRRTPWSLTL